MWEPESPAEICLKLWEDKPCQKFVVPCNGLNSIDVWIHELSELGVKCWFYKKGSELEEWWEDGVCIFIPLNTAYMIKRISIKLPDGNLQYHRIDHVLTSLVMVSNIEIKMDSIYLIQPDNYEKMVNGIDIIRL